MLLFRTHLISLFVELLNQNLLWADISFQLFNFVVQNELELLQLLHCLLKLCYFFILAFNRLCALFFLLFASIDVSPDFFLLDKLAFKLVLHLLESLGVIAPLHVHRHQLAHVLSELSLILHSFFNVECQDVLVFVCHRVYLIPCILLCFTSLSHDTLLLSAIFGVQSEHFFFCRLKRLVVSHCHLPK